ncbi:thiolase [Mytilinidion resinicola]|uniref:Thiolase n=1 Tax=Mytilinidion resinicola TaxID=574789 RepID=A0A6A6YFL7_9PEZI|nr:thiolase [Mytilinidion resinicola]KAF2806814.1 thiolase [Mytilinidion resinicola]
MAPPPAAPTYVLGVGMTAFVKPSGRADYTELGFEADVKAMLDAQINYDDVDNGIACYVYGDSACGQRVFYQFGMTQIPIYNVNNNCSTGSTGLNLARNFISHGVADCVLVVGFEKMFAAGISTVFADRADPVGTTTMMMKETRGLTKAPNTAQIFGNAGREYMERYGATVDDFAEIARINHEHSQNNPYAQFRDTCTLDEVKNSRMIYEPLTKLQCCPTSDGGAAVILVSEAFLDAQPHLKEQAVLIAGQCLATESPKLFSQSAIDLLGYEMGKYAGKVAMKEAGVTPKDIDVVEFHDCFSTNEMVAIDALGFTPLGKAHELVRKGDITYGGEVVINPSGGLILKELLWQLRGWANNRLVENAKVSLQHNLGLGGAIVVTVYIRADRKPNRMVDSNTVGKKNKQGYNPAVQRKGFTVAQAESVRSKTRASAWALGDTQSKVLARF